MAQAHKCAKPGWEIVPATPGNRQESAHASSPRGAIRPDAGSCATGVGKARRLRIVNGQGRATSRKTTLKPLRQRVSGLCQGTDV